VGEDEEGEYVIARGREVGEFGVDEATVETLELEDREERDHVAERLELDVDGREDGRSGISRTET
jgi:hypothetical protein